jgi:hypothetical protein
MVLSCVTRNFFDETNEMHLLISNYYQEKLSLIKLNNNKITEEKPILDLTELRGNMIIQAGFLTPNTVYVVFQGDRGNFTEKPICVRIYDTVSSNWEDVFTYRISLGSVRIIDIENSGGYFVESLTGKTLRYLDFQNQTSNAIFDFPDGEKITAINCRYSDQFVIINTYKETEKLFHYYFIDKFSHEKINEGIGQIYLNKHSDFIIYENNSNIYMINDTVNPTKRIEIPVENGKLFSSAIAVGENCFLVCSVSTTPDYLSRYLFGSYREIEHYDYRIIRIFDIDKLNFEYKKLQISSDKKVIFDGMINE